MKWYEYLLSINDKIGEERRRQREGEDRWTEMDKTEQIVPNEDKMIQDLGDDTWSLIRS